MENARNDVLNLLLNMERQQSYSNLSLDRFLKQTDLSGADRGFVSACFYGVLERKLTLDAVLEAHSSTPLKKMEPIVRQALRLGAFQLLFMEKIPPHAAIHETVELLKKRGLSRATGFVNAVLRAIERNPNPLDFQDADPVARLSKQYSVSTDIAALMLDQYVQEAADLLQATLEQTLVYIRVNSLKVTDKELIELLKLEGILAQSVDGVDHALAIAGSLHIEQCKAFAEGLFHVQDLASQLCAAALQAQPGHHVLDLCAAPGGKSYTLAQYMQDQGVLVACDLHSSRVKLIESGAKRLGIKCIRAMQNDATKVRTALGLFDRVLCDVPCSGFGVMGKKPEIRYKSTHGLERLYQTQATILNQAAQLLKIGGRLVYSTCTLNPKENGEIVGRFLSDNPNIRPCALPLSEGQAGGFEQTLLPHIHHTDGFYMAAMEKIG